MTENMLLAGLIGGGVLIVLTLVIFGFMQSQKARAFTHAERIKALEMGQPLPDDPETARIKAKMARTSAAIESVESADREKSFATQCFTMTGYICGGGFFFAFVSGGSVAYALAASAGAVGVTGMICGTILATKESVPNPAKPLSKPRFDPEAV